MGSDITAALRLERLDRYSYLARPDALWRPAGSRAVYGGQVFGLAMLAAHQTLGGTAATEAERLLAREELPLHSAHAMFLLPGRADMPILYSVDPIRNGKSFTTRSVKAVQDGQCIFTATMSFHRRESSVSHSVPMPDVPPPDALLTTEQHLETLLADGALSESQRRLVDLAMRMQQPMPLDVRIVDGLANPFDETPREARQLAWIRAKLPEREQAVQVESCGSLASGAVGAPADDLAGPGSYMHRCIAAFASDWTLCLASLRPHGLSMLSPRLRMLTSIDHSMWYHRPFDATQWMLYETDSPVATGGRSLNHGRLFDAQGNLCVSVSQEALVRADPKGDPQTK